MTKKKPVVVHRIYTARHASGSNKTKNRAFGKCLCGAVLEGQEQIDEHRLLVVDPSETHPTAKAG